MLDSRLNDFLVMTNFIIDKGQPVHDKLWIFSLKLLSSVELLLQYHNYMFLPKTTVSYEMELLKDAS